MRSWGEVTAIFGGTFDPPHLGHREAVAGLFRRPGVREVWVMPSAAPPHKPTVASAEQRLELCRLAFRAHPGFPFPAEIRIDAREIERARNGNPTFTFDTLKELGRELGPGHVAFVIGADQLAQIGTWHRFPEVLTLAHWIVLERKPQGATALKEALAPLLGSNRLRPSGDSRWAIPGGPTELQAVPTDAPELSSTSIRQAIGRNGQVPENTVIPAVSAYLKTHRIYGTEGEET